MKQLEEAGNLLNSVAKTYVEQHPISAGCKEEEEVDEDDGDEEWSDVSSDDSEKENPVWFLSLSKYLADDSPFQENLKKMETIVDDMKNGDLYNIIQKYQSTLEGIIYIVKAIQVDSNQFQTILDKIPTDLERIEEISQESEGETDEEEEEEEESHGLLHLHFRRRCPGCHQFHEVDSSDDDSSEDEGFHMFLAHMLLMSAIHHGHGHGSVLN